MGGAMGGVWPAVTRQLRQENNDSYDLVGNVNITCRSINVLLITIINNYTSINNQYITPFSHLIT